MKGSEGEWPIQGGLSPLVGSVSRSRNLRRLWCGICGVIVPFLSRVHPVVIFIDWKFQKLRRLGLFFLRLAFKFVQIAMSWFSLRGFDIRSVWLASQVFCSFSRSFLKTFVNRHVVVCEVSRNVSQHIQCRWLIFATYSSHSLTRTHSPSHNFIWTSFLRNAKRNPHNFSRIRCSYGSHEPSTMDLISLSHSRSLSLSLARSLSLLIIFFYVEQSAASSTKTPDAPAAV